MKKTSKSGLFRLFHLFVLNLKLLLDRGISVAKLHALDFQSRNISRAPGPGAVCFVPFSVFAFLSVFLGDDDDDLK